MHSLMDAAADVTRFEWIGLRPVEMTDPSGALTTWEYSDDDPVRVTWPNGNVVEIEYQTGGLNRDSPQTSARASVRDSVGVIQRNDYDDLGRVVFSFNGADETTTIWYSELGQVVVISKPDGQVTWFREYGEHGHAELVEKTGGLAQRRRFDAVGNLLAGPDLARPVDPGRPGIVSRAFDADRNLISLELAGGTDADPLSEQQMELVVEYRSDRRPLRIFRPYGGDTRFDYDAAGRVVARSERVDGVWQTTRYEYATGGRLSATEWPNGMRHEIDRDEVGHPAALRLMRNGVVEKSLVSTWTSGRLVSRRDSERPGLETISYDTAGRISAIQFPEGEHLEFQRDLRGREVGRVYRLQAGGEPFRTLSKSYDAAGRLAEWRDQGESILKRIYQEGRLIEELSGNGLARNFLYDEEGLLTDAITRSQDQYFPYLFTTYEWQSCGSLHYCVTSFTLGQTGPHSSVEVSSGFESYRLGPISMTDDGLDHAGARVRSWGTSPLADGNYEGEGEYGFDALGNWLGVWLGETEKARFTYNEERNRLLAADLNELRSYTWDDAGFMLSRDGAPIEWDAGGQPVALGADTGMEWDTLGRLISVRAGEQVSHTLFGGSMQGDGSRNPVSLDLRVVKIDLMTGQRTYRHIDQRGNVQFVTDHQGVMSRYYSYSPFGVSETWGDGEDGRNFAMGQPVGDYLWLGDRLYDPETGRFLSPDPQYQLINQFAYTLGNPIFFWDPDGRHAVPSSLVRAAEFLLDLADRIESLGYTAFAAGLSIASPPVMVSGLAAVAASLALRWLVNYGCACVPRVDIEDLPDGYTPEQGAKPASLPES
ncbi:MAG: RHS repeat-associated core domain-containing protein, partial [Myxococcota bacterium]